MRSTPGRSNSQVPAGMLMRLRMLISHSLAVSAWPALPGSAFRPLNAWSMRATTSSSACSDIDGFPRYGVELGLVAIEFLEQVGLQVGARSNVHDLEDRGQREMMIDSSIARHQLPEPVEQVLEPQHRANALVERVLVEHGTELPQPSRSSAMDCGLFHRASGVSALAGTETPERAHFVFQFGDRQALIEDHRVSARAARLRVRPVG